MIDVQLPCIVHWKAGHYVVVYKILNDIIWIVDPAHGREKLTRNEFEKHWLTGAKKGICLLVEMAT
ncbi:MAG: cysteine peptidase family C39 domain-containing protein [Bacteroidota bacterium]